MQPYIARRTPEQKPHLALRQPDCFIFKADIQANRLVRLIDHYLVLRFAHNFTSLLRPDHRFIVAFVVSYFLGPDEVVVNDDLGIAAAHLHPRRTRREEEDAIATKSSCASILPYFRVPYCVFSREITETRVRGTRKAARKETFGLKADQIPPKTCALRATTNQASYV